MEDPLVLVLRVSESIGRVEDSTGGGEWDADEEAEEEVEEARGQNIEQARKADKSGSPAMPQHSFNPRSAHRKRINDVRIARLIALLRYQNFVLRTLDHALVEDSSASSSLFTFRDNRSLVQMLDGLRRTSELKRAITRGQLGLAGRIRDLLGNGLVEDKGVEKLVRLGEEELEDIEAEGL